MKIKRIIAWLIVAMTGQFIGFMIAALMLRVKDITPDNIFTVWIFSLGVIGVFVGMPLTVGWAIETIHKGDV